MKAGQQEGSLQVGSSVISLCPEREHSRVLASSYGVQPKTMATVHVVLRAFLTESFIERDPHLVLRSLFNNIRLLARSIDHPSRVSAFKLLKKKL